MIIQESINNIILEKIVKDLEIEFTPNLDILLKDIIDYVTATANGYNTCYKIMFLEQDLMHLSKHTNSSQCKQLYSYLLGMTTSIMIEYKTLN